MDLVVARSEFVVPEICYICIEYLRTQGMNEPGLFRVPGNNQVMQELKAQLDEKEEVKLVDIHDTAGLLKNYLRSVNGEKKGRDWSKKS